MSDFSLSLAYLLKNEGGYVNDPHDAGGPTNCGITLATLARHREHTVAAEDVENLTEADIASVYLIDWWVPLGLSDVKPGGVATAIFDACVLFGIFEGALCAQRALVSLGFTYIAVDGKLGKRTTAALNIVKPDVFLGAFVLTLLALIVAIVKAHPGDGRYSGGWEKRVRRYVNLKA